MSLDQLVEEIKSIPWFTTIGHAASSDFAVPVLDLGKWHQFMKAMTQAEFGLPHDTSILSEEPFSQMSWLPTANSDIDPIHDDSLTTIAQRAGQKSGLISAKLAAFKAAGASQRAIHEHSNFNSGSTNFMEAACSGGRYACRMAAAETFLGIDGFWCNVLKIYRQGNWPFGLLPDGKVVVL